MRTLNLAQEKLLSELKLLNSFEKMIVNICSLWWGPVPIENLLRLLRASGVVLPKGGFLTTSSLDQHIFKLIEMNFLTRSIECNQSITELVARQASTEPGFEKLADYILENWSGNNGSLDDQCTDILRNIRISILKRDEQGFLSQFNQMQMSCVYNMHYTMPLTSMIAEPFDPQWMKTLPLAIQEKMFDELIPHVINTATPLNMPILDYFCTLDLSGLEERRADIIRCHSGSALLMSAQGDKAKKIISLIQTPELSAMLQGWLYFLKGDDQRAIEYFDKALAMIRKMTGSKKFFLKSNPGLIYLLSLLRVRSEQSLKKMKTLLSHAKARTNSSHNTFFMDAYNSLEAIADHVSMNIADARKWEISTFSSDRIVAEFVTYLGKFWVNRKLSSTEKKGLTSLYRKSSFAGLDWLAMETGFLLEKADPKAIKPFEKNHIQRVKDKTGLTPLAHSVDSIEDWRLTLKAMQKIGDAQKSKPNQVSEGRKQSRLVWLVSYRQGRYLMLKPKLQTINQKGQWSAGRNIALKTLFNESGNLDYLSNEDRKILPAIKNNSQHYSSTWYNYELDRILPLIVGHPLLFLDSSPQTSVEFIRSEPEVSVVKSGNDYVLSMVPEIKDESVVLIQDNPTRFRVIQAGPEHKLLAEILAGRQIKVPKAGHDELLQTISSLSGLVTIHSDITGEDKSIPEVKAHSVPCIRIYPAGSGFKADMTVRPFKTEGPFLKPGQGRQNVIAEVNGKRMQAKRDLSNEKAMAAEVEASCQVFERLEQDDLIWTIPGPDDCLVLLSELKGLQDKGLVSLLWPEGEKLSFAGTMDFDKLALELSSGQDWFDMKGKIKVDPETVINLIELLNKMQESPGRFIFLDDKRFISLTSRLRQKLREINHLSEKKGDKLRMPAYSLLILDELSQESAVFKGDKSWKELQQSIKEAFSIKPKPPSTLKAELRQYQTAGFEWLSRMARLGLGVCLADDMGLGKTVQSLAVILERAPKGPSLVVAPTSVCPNWLSEAMRFAPTLKPILYSGKDRHNILNKLEPFSLIICSYGLLMQDAEELCSLDWQNVVLDEAQAIKNWSAKRTQAAMNLKAGFRLATTGTPIENNLTELWSLFRFLNPGLLGPRKQFNEQFVFNIQNSEDSEQKRMLKRIIQPFILRRLKSQVMDELPPRTEITLKVSMSEEEAVLYEAIRLQALEKLKNEVQQGGAKNKGIRIITELNRLRQLCCHPRMLYPESKAPGSKLALFEEIVTELLANGHKALVFSQFVKHLTLVRERLDELKIDYRYLDGSTPGHARQKEIMDFQEGKGDLFLISLKAGGLGLNLTAADYVIHLDPWWNPAVEDQATDRSHRMGQKNPVTVYRLVTENTVEEKIVRLHAEKKDLANSLLEGSDVSAGISAEELMKLFTEKVVTV